MRALLLGIAAALAASPAAAAVGTIAAPSVTSSLVLRIGAGDLFGVNVVSGASAGYVMLFDAAATPPDGAVTPVACLPVAANTGLDWNFRAAPTHFVTGIVAVFSTSGCYSKAASATAFISGAVQ